MPTTPLTVVPVELISSTRTSPANGAPSSQDYNDSQKEVLADLYSLSSFLNDFLSPMLATLTTTAAQGIDGSNILANPESSNAAFRDVNGNPLVIADVLTALQTKTDTSSRAVLNMQALLTQIQTRLASTYQNDLRQSVQGISDSVRSIQSALTTVNAELTVLQQAQAGVATNVTFVDAEVPTGVVDGSNPTFSLVHVPTPALGLQLFVDGKLQHQSVDYTLSGNVITFITIPGAGKPVVASYRY